MEWTVDNRGHEGGVRVVMEGDCDLYNAPLFKQEMLGRLDSGCRSMLFDMSGIRYLDSTGVGAIISLLQASRRLGGDLCFAGLSGNPKRVLEMSSILPLMKLEPGVAK